MSRSKLNGRKVIVPVLMVPGHRGWRDDGASGLGPRVEAGRVAAGVGFNAYLLRTSDDPLYAGGAKLTKLDGTYDLCVTKVHNIEHRGAFAQQDLEKPLSDKDGTYSLAGHEAMERAIIRYATLDEVKKNPNFAHEGASGTLVNKVGYAPQGEKPGHGRELLPGRVELQADGSVVAEDAERVGHGDRPEQLHRLQCLHRELLCGEQYSGGGPRAGEDRPQHAVDPHRYLLRGRSACAEGALPADGLPALRERGLRAGLPGGRDGAYAGRPEHDGLQPLRGDAVLLEQLPVQGAAVQLPAVLGLRHGEPEVHAQSGCHVRSRGVMEKCSYCVQRIEAAKIKADKENRAIRDGDIVTACQQACPTDAIMFGNINDPSSKVAKRKAEERDYQVLADLNFRPRTTYTAGVINPNPELA